MRAISDNKMVQFSKLIKCKLSILPVRCGLYACSEMHICLSLTVFSFVHFPYSQGYLMNII